MTGEEFITFYDRPCSELRLPLTREDMAGWILATDRTPEELDTIAAVLDAMLLRRHESIILTLRKLSRIPQRNPMTFGNFSTELLNAKAAKQVGALRSLSFISAGRNVIMVGPTGTGKTHLAMAIGNECCEKRIKAYFIKMDELRDRFHEAMRCGTGSRLLGGLAKYSCLIIDEVGYCRFDRDETLMFFQLVDRFSSKGTGSIVMTSNKDLADWEDMFDEPDALECSIDRLWDKAICLTFSGGSHRGGQKEEIELDFARLK